MFIAYQCDRLWELQGLRLANSYDYKAKGDKK